MRLYTKTDLERCARLAVKRALSGIESDDESAVHHAVDLVTESTPPLYDKDTVLAVARCAVEIASAHPGGLVIDGQAILDYSGTIATQAFTEIVNVSRR